MSEAMIEQLATLVNVESPSHDIAAITESAHVVAALLAALTGSAPELVDSPVGPHVHWKGGGTPKVLILGHHDTVFPLGTLAQRPFTVADGRATGPGVFDMKAGIVLAANAVAALDDPSGVEMLFTADEEVGSRASRALLEERAIACGHVLVLEPSADGGALKIGRKGLGTFELGVHGRASHAGLEPEKGVNALVEAARQVLAITTIGRPEIGTTVTPTMASAGTAENVVPALATMRVDVRVSTLDEAARVTAAMEALSAVDPQATLTLGGAINRPPMHPSSSTELFELAQQVAADLGQSVPDGVVVGGGSDGNFTAALGVATLDGLGATGGGAHADHEWVDVAALAPRRDLLTALINAMG